jgi:hypothetical protein
MALVTDWPGENVPITEEEHRVWSLAANRGDEADYLVYLERLRKSEYRVLQQQRARDRIRVELDPLGEVDPLGRGRHRIVLDEEPLMLDTKTKLYF